eukprot:scaffold13610_cov159-Ochromonas_danica.AAC.3
MSIDSCDVALFVVPQDFFIEGFWDDVGPIRTDHQFCWVFITAGEQFHGDTASCYKQTPGTVEQQNRQDVVKDNNKEVLSSRLLE